MNLKEIKEDNKKYIPIGCQTVLELIERIEFLESQVREKESELMVQDCINRNAGC